MNVIMHVFINEINLESLLSVTVSRDRLWQVSRFTGLIFCDVCCILNL